MRLQSFVLLLLAAAACGPGRDSNFYRIIQLTAVPKIEVLGKHVYYAEDHALKRVGTDGGTPDVLFTGGVVDFATAPGHAFAATTMGIIDVPLTANGMPGNPSSLTSTPALAVAADGNGVSWVDCTTITHAELDGTNRRGATLTGPCANADTRLAIDSSTAYGVNGSGLYYASRSGAEPRGISSIACEHLGAAGGWLYCSDETNGLKRINPLDSTYQPVITGKVHTFDIGESRVYAAVGEDLVSSPRNTTNYEVLGTYAAVSAIPVDANAVYFVNTEGDLGLMLKTAL